MTEKPISPIAAQQGQRVEAKADRRCRCKKLHAGMRTTDAFNPNCPVHGHGRPAGTIG